MKNDSDKKKNSPFVFISFFRKIMVQEEEFGKNV